MVNLAIHAPFTGHASFTLLDPTVERGNILYSDQSQGLKIISSEKAALSD